MKKRLPFLIACSLWITAASAQQKSKTGTQPTSSATQTNPSSAVQKQEGAFRVVFNTNSYNSGLAYLCYHMGKNLNIEDSAMMVAVGNSGQAVFKGSRKLPGGIYAIVFPGKRFSIDFFVDKDQEIAVSADTNNLQNAVIEGAKENVMFQQYQKFVSEKGSKMQQERMAYNDSRTKADSVLHEKNYNMHSMALNQYRDSVITNYPESMMSVMLKTMKEPEIINKNPKTRQDSLDNYYYYKSHYWDGVTFMDERVIRTPFFQPKLERYYREIVSQAPDSINADIDYRLLFARNSPEMFKYLLNWFTDEYINPKIMGQDAVYVHLYEKYHSKGLTPWLNEKQMKTVTDRAYMVMSNLIGVRASNLEMVDSTGRMKPLYDLKADYTLVIFWDPTCGHCKEEIPRIDSIYKASWKARNVRIYSVLSDNDKFKDWVNYIKEKKIGEWTHVYETKEMEKAVAAAQRPSFRQLYDVISTPTLVLLDKDKNIIGKKLGWEQLNDFLKVKWKGNAEK